MEYRPFGQTGIKISAIGFGCWEIGGGYGSIEETEFVKAINRALDVGFNSFDTAEAYGMGASEKSLAKALGSRRKEAVITTKVGVGYPDKPNYRDSSRQRVMESIEKSLKALNTDYVDVYLIHWPDRTVPFEEPMRALDDLVKQGKVRAVGLSNFKLDEIKTCMAARRVDVMQYCWNMFDRRMQTEIFPYCQENKIGVMAYGSLAYGMLTGTLSEEKAFEKGDWRAKRGQEFAGGGRTEGSSDALWQEHAATSSAVDAVKPDNQHCTCRMPESQGGRRQCRRVGMVDIRCRHERDRYDLRPAWGGHHARCLAGDYLGLHSQYCESR